jgi:hypothetical protein
MSFKANDIVKLKREVVKEYASNYRRSFNYEDIVHYFRGPHTIIEMDEPMCSCCSGYAIFTHPANSPIHFDPEDSREWLAGVEDLVRDEDNAKQPECPGCAWKHCRRTLVGK